MFWRQWIILRGGSSCFWSVFPNTGSFGVTRCNVSGRIWEFSSLGLQCALNARGLSGCGTDPDTFFYILNTTALPGSAMLVTAVHRSFLYNEHNWDLGRRGLNSILGDLCWELKQLQCGAWLMQWVSCGDDCPFSWLCLWFIPISTQWDSVTKGTSFWVPFASVSSMGSAFQASACKLCSYILSLIVLWLSNNMFYLTLWCS